MARPTQLPPEGNWFTWFIRAGRGWGKTRTGAEWAKQRGLESPNRRIALVAQTFTDGRDVMVEGESGLLSILQPAQLRGGSVEAAWNRSMGELFLANGSRFKIYSSEKSGQLRGPQHHFAWGDEPAKWADAKEGTKKDTTYSNLLFGLRLGENPKLCLTGTPENNALVKEVCKNPKTHVTIGKTSENLDNLAPTFRAEIMAAYEGTRLGRQELDAEILEDITGALWQSSMFEAEGFRLNEPATYKRIVVGVDPSVSDNDNSDEMGIIVVGLTPDERMHVLGDYTTKGSVNTRAAAVVSAFHDHGADKCVLEVNNGGDWIPNAIENVDPLVGAACKSVHATRGKLTRAEPIAGLYEKGHAHHVGKYLALESELTGWVPGMKSPNRLDALVWACWELTQGSQPIPAKTPTLPKIGRRM